MMAFFSFWSLEHSFSATFPNNIILWVSGSKSSDFGTEISIDDLFPLSVIPHSSPINTKEHCKLHTPLLMLIWHFLYLILVVCLISIFFHDSWNRPGCSCLPYCSSVNSPGQFFFLEQRVVHSPSSDQHRTHALQTSSSGRQQSFSGFLFWLHWECQDRGLHQYTATLLFYHHWHVAFSGDRSLSVISRWI